MAYKLKNAVPYILSLFWIVLTLWAVLTPNEVVHNFFKQLDYVTYDIRLRTTFTNLHYIKNPIFIVDIDNQSIREEGSWPWSRDKVSLLIKQLQMQGAKVIAFDTLFSEPEVNITQVFRKKLIQEQIDDPYFYKKLTELAPLFDNDQQLVTTLHNSNNVVLPFYLYANLYQQGQLPSPLETLSSEERSKVTVLNLPGYATNTDALQKASKHNGFVANVRDEDGVVRRTPLVIRSADGIYPSLTLSAIQIYTHANIKLHFDEIGDTMYLTGINLGTKFIPTDKAGRVMIPFHGNVRHFPYISAKDILHNKIPNNVLNEAIIFVSSTAAGLDDLQITPMSPFFPSIEVQANVASGLLDNNFPYIPYWAKTATILLIVLIGVILTCLLPILGPVSSIVLAIFIVSTLIATNLLLWLKYGLVFSFSFPMIMTFMIVLTNMTYGFLFENRKGRFLRKVFSEYVPAEHVKVLTENPDQYSLEGESREMTVLFADICGFTSISEHLDPTQIKKVLNAYFTPMTEIIFKHGGTVDKYVGDMIMAFWGAPLENKQHREDAIETTLQMQAKVKQLHREFKSIGWPEVNIGIGLNTGIMNVGDMGSEYRRAYTVLGDSVNLGSRLESTTRYYGVDIVVGQDTVINRDRYLYRLLDRIKVKGKNQMIEVFELVCRMSEATDEMKMEVATYEQAIIHYFAQQWTEAKELLNTLKTQYPHHKLYPLILERIEYYEKITLPQNWDGAYERHEK
jgi:adenylate cyclase